MTADQPRTGIRLLTEQDAERVLAFELANREWFRSSIPDRGDAYFSEFPARHRALVEEQAVGTARFFLVVDEREELVGRVNLVDIGERAASLGYRIGREHVGQGHARRAATLALREASAMGLQEVVASTTADNVASQRVLRAVGFLPVDEGPRTLDIGGRVLPARHFTVRLASIVPAG